MYIVCNPHSLMHVHVDSTCMYMYLDYLPYLSVPVLDPLSSSFRLESPPVSLRQSLGQAVSCSCWQCYHWPPGGQEGGQLWTAEQ